MSKIAIGAFDASAPAFMAEQAQTERQQYYVPAGSNSYVVTMPVDLTSDTCRN